jgi:hypothetical protein
VNAADIDRVLFEHIRVLVNFVNQQGWIIHWHFFRESENWQGRRNQAPLILRIRFRVRVYEANLQATRTYLTTELDTLRTNARIADHYRGNHGNPNQEYVGEAANFDETIANPQGWEITQKWLEAGSEIELVLLKNRFQGTVLGRRFVLPDLLHFAANQFGRNNFLMQPANQFVIQI